MKTKLFGLTAIVFLLTETLAQTKKTDLKIGNNAEMNVVSAGLVIFPCVLPPKREPSMLDLEACGSAKMEMDLSGEISPMKARVPIDNFGFDKNNLVINGTAVDWLKGCDYAVIVVDDNETNGPLFKAKKIKKIIGGDTAQLIVIEAKLLGYNGFYCEFKLNHTGVFLDDKKIEAFVFLKQVGKTDPLLSRTDSLESLIQAIDSLSALHEIMTDSLEKVINLPTSLSEKEGFFYQWKSVLLYSTALKKKYHEMLIRNENEKLKRGMLEDEYKQNVILCRVRIKETQEILDEFDSMTFVQFLVRNMSKK